MGLARSLSRRLAKGLANSLAGASSGVSPLAITPSTPTPVAGADVDFDTNATDFGTPVSYEWDFGDGTIPVSGATPSHWLRNVENPARLESATRSSASPRSSAASFSNVSLQISACPVVAPIAKSSGTRAIHTKQTSKCVYVVDCSLRGRLCYREKGPANDLVSMEVVAVCVESQRLFCCAIERATLALCLWSFDV